MKQPYATGGSWKNWVAVIVLLAMFGPTLALQLRSAFGVMVAALAPIVAVGAIVAVVVMLVRAYRNW